MELAPRYLGKTIQNPLEEQGGIAGRGKKEEKGHGKERMIIKRPKRKRNVCLVAS